MTPGPPIPAPCAATTGDVVVGAVLTGGASRRMGRDKALVTVGGRALVTIGVDALRAAGAGTVWSIGGDAHALGAVDPRLVPVADLHPGEGPLGGLLTACAAARRHAVTTTPGRPPGDLILVVIACDMPTIDGASLAALVDALRAAPRSALAAAVVDDRPQPLTAAWRPTIAEPVLAAAFAAGERAPRRLLDRFEIVAVEGLDATRLGDVDRPADLHRYADAGPAPAAAETERPGPAPGPTHPAAAGGAR